MNTGGTLNPCTCTDDSDDSSETTDEDSSGTTDETSSRTCLSSNKAYQGYGLPCMDAADQPSWLFTYSGGRTCFSGVRKIKIFICPCMTYLAIFTHLVK